MTSLGGIICVSTYLLACLSDWWSTCLSIYLSTSNGKLFLGRSYLVKTRRIKPKVTRIGNFK